MPFRPRFILLITFSLILAPVWAQAEAHPGPHLNPHIPNVVLYAALGFAGLSALSMWIYLFIQRVKRRRLIEDRLDLRDARRASRSLRTGRSHTVPFAEVKRRLGL